MLGAETRARDFTYPILTGKIKVAEDLLFQIKILLVHCRNKSSVSQSSIIQVSSPTHPEELCDSAPPSSSTAAGPACSASKPAGLPPTRALWLPQRPAAARPVRQCGVWTAQRQEPAVAPAFRMRICPTVLTLGRRGSLSCAASRGRLRAWSLGIDGRRRESTGRLRQLRGDEEAFLG